MAVRTGTMGRLWPLPRMRSRNFPPGLARPGPSSSRCRVRFPWHHRSSIPSIVSSSRRARRRASPPRLAPIAERWLRRAHLDLIGLPPTPEETAEFLADSRPDAWERVIERLLASPHYGERWGRHWLDVARYADSDGFEQDLRSTQRVAISRLRHFRVQ